MAVHVGRCCVPSLAAPRLNTECSAPPKSPRCPLMASQDGSLIRPSHAQRSREVFFAACFAAIGVQIFVALSSRFA